MGGAGGAERDHDQPTTTGSTGRSSHGARKPVIEVLATTVEEEGGGDGDGDGDVGGGGGNGDGGGGRAEGGARGGKGEKDVEFSQEKKTGSWEEEEEGEEGMEVEEEVEEAGKGEKKAGKWPSWVRERFRTQGYCRVLFSLPGVSGGSDVDLEVVDGEVLSMDASKGGFQPVRISLGSNVDERAIKARFSKKNAELLVVIPFARRGKGEGR